MKKQKNILVEEILKRAKQEQKYLGHYMARACEYFLRLRGGQISIAREILEELVPREFEGKLYTGRPDDLARQGWELGELLQCYQKYGECEYAMSCQNLTTRFYCQKRRDIKEKESESK